MPDPTKYRPFVKKAFDGVSAYAGRDSKYTPDAASIRSGLRSGNALVLNFTMDCPPLAKTDCEGVWLDFGECEKDGSKLMRFAVEKMAAAGGQPCDHLEGKTRRVSC